MSGQERIRQVLDEGTFEEWDRTDFTDPLEFKDRKSYADRIVAEQKRTGLLCSIDRLWHDSSQTCCHWGHGFRFYHGKYGVGCGERSTRLIERATEQNLPLIIISGSGGGARMHEGILS